ncbi:Protein mpe1 [Neocucurbitaria cava]|uniref:Protein mpe1 n=1 Tax=Neocucurbitaria cava TaxID=798079 RepID=A0A9W8YEC2_9PLEO|nr:Protein mpe1 [Neocucurbitaria cava]
MSSSVFYKFKNSREPERIVFDGTDITVFELKRDIITASGLGDGTDFDLHLYPEDDPKAEYDDDTTTISRSSTVIVVRRPAARGHGRAARYVSGKAPVRAIKKETKPTVPIAGATLNEADAEAAFLAESAQVWDAQKETLAHAKPVFHKKKPVNVPTHEPPPGYVCYRCHQKGHWIQACPTNSDPDFKPTIRAKRTTGIPQSFLKKVEKPVDDEDARGVMMNADGEYVQVMTDNRTWEKFQEKANASKAQAASADAASKEVRERGLECPLDKRMFVNPVKTPCCGKTYCHECIDNALADGDLICPNCAKEDVLMDDLVPDEEMVKSIKAYEAEKAKEKLDREKEQAKAEAKAAEQPAAATASPPIKNETESSAVPVETSSTTTASNNDTTTSSLTTTVAATTAAAADPAVEASSATPGATGGNGNASDTESTTSKKRKSPPTEIKPPTAPKAMRQQKEQAANPAAAMEQEFIQQMEALKNGGPAMPLPMLGGVPNMPSMPNMSNMGNMPNMPNNMGFPGQMQMPGFNNMNGPMGGFNPMMNMNMNNMNMMNMNGGQMMGGGPGGGMAMHHQHNNNPQMNGYGNGMGMGMNHQQQQWQNNNQNNGYGGGGGGFGAGMNGYGGQAGMGMGGMGMGMGMGMMNAAGGGAGGADYNDAYERQPVNPRGRHRKAARAPDYRHVQ